MAPPVVLTDVAAFDGNLPLARNCLLPSYLLISGAASLLAI